MDNQDPVVSSPTPTPAEVKASPDFPDLAKASFQFLSRFWSSYLKLGFILAIPVVIGFLVIGFFFFSTFLQSALGFGGFEAHAAPAIPSKPQVIEESAVPAVVETVPGAASPTEVVPVSDPSAVQADPGLGASGTATPDVAPLAEDQPSSILGNPESVGSKEVKTPNSDFFGTGSVPRINFPENGDSSGPTMGFSGLAPSLLGMGSLIVLPLVFGLLVVLYQLIVMLSFTRLTVVLEKNEYVGAMPVVKWAIRYSGTYLSLVFRIFIYSTLWIPIVAMLVYSVLMFLASAEIVIPGMTLISFVIGLASLVSIPLAFIRTPRTLFAHFALADRECGSKEALDHSIEISIGHWWQIVVYLVGIGIVASLTSGILTSIIGKISPVAGALVSIALSILITFYMVIFNYGMFHMLESQFSPQK